MSTDTFTGLLPCFDALGGDIFRDIAEGDPVYRVIINDQHYLVEDLAGLDELLRRLWRNVAIGGQC